MEKRGQEHRLLLQSRENLEISGVINVESFDDKKIVLETVQGLLILQGEDLHIKRLNLDDGNIGVEGSIDALQYSEVSRGVRDKGKGFIEKLLR